MKHIISYSGGVGSAITAELVANRYGEENVSLLFADTLIEDEDLYRFNADIELLLNLPITVISDGRTPWQVFKDVKFVGNTRIDPCSKILKRDLIRRYLLNNYEPEAVTVWIGIDASEGHRLGPVVERNKPYAYRSILIENEVMLSGSDKITWCREKGLEPPRLYELGFSHNNCGGFCVKAGLGHFKRLYELLPDVYLMHENEQEAAQKGNPKLKPFLRKNINGEIIYLTLKQYREAYLEEAGVSEDESLEHGGCGCAL